MNNEILKPGTVVCAHYNAFKGDDRVGVFCVLYDEQLDSSNNYKGNIVALKVTSQNKMISNYCVPIRSDVDKFFEQDCIVLCSKIHVIEKEQCYKKIGNLSSQTLRQVYRMYRQFERELERQVEDYT